MKRIFDIAISSIGLIILSPFLLVIAILIELTSPGPIFYRAERIGKDGVPFELYKFRSMTSGADKTGPKITAQGDARVTPLGRWLRRLKLDEFPQFINVLKGDMSIVGPRPEDPHYVSYYTPEQQKVLSVLPGITSAASVRYRHEEAMLSSPDWETRYRAEVLPAKLAIDLAYLERRTLWTDFTLILQTIAAMFEQ